MKKILNIFNIGEWIFLIIAIALILTFGVIYKIFYLEIISTILGLCAASLNVKAKRYCFFFYVVFVLIYGYISFINHQYGEAILNICYNLPLYLFTLYRFYLAKQKDHGNNNLIHKLSIKHWIFISILIIVITIAYGFILKSIVSSLPFINSLATAFALIASFLASKRFKDQWIFWMGYSIVLIYLWLNTFFQTNDQGLIYLILNILYVIINLYGFIHWQKKYHLQNK